MEDGNTRFDTIDNETLKLEGEVEETKDGFDHYFRHAAEIEMDKIPAIATAVTVMVENQNFRHPARDSSTPSN